MQNISNVTSVLEYTASLPKSYRYNVLRSLRKLQTRQREYYMGNKHAIHYRNCGICTNTTNDVRTYLSNAARFWPERTKKSGAKDYPVGGRDAYWRDSWKGTQWEGKQGAKRRRLLNWLIQQLKASLD